MKKTARENYENLCNQINSWPEWKKNCGSYDFEKTERDLTSNERAC